MSLKTFHIIFIFASGLLSLGMFVWGLRLYLAEGGSRNLGLGILGALMAVALFFYERWFSGKFGPLSRHE